MTITAAHVHDRLVHRGYRIVNRTAHHWVYEHHGDRVVVPQHEPQVDPWAARVIEQALAPRLGPGWLSAPDGASDAPQPAIATTRRRLSVVLRQTPRRDGWRAFVPEEPGIVTFGSTLDDTRRLVEDAALAWFGPSVDVELDPVMQLDPTVRSRVEQATAPGATDRTVAAATDELLGLGMDPSDVAALLPPTNRAVAA